MREIKLIYVVNKIDELIDQHGQPSLCQLKNCVTCNKINELRSMISEKTSKRAARNRFKSNYILTDLKTNESSEFNTQSEAADFLGIRPQVFQYQISKHNLICGFKAERIYLE